MGDGRWAMGRLQGTSASPPQGHAPFEELHTLYLPGGNGHELIGAHSELLDGGKGSPEGAHLGTDRLLFPHSILVSDSSVPVCPPQLRREGKAD